MSKHSNHDATPTHISLHYVKPDDVEVIVTVFDNFANVTVKVGRFEVVLFTGDETDAQHICESLMNNVTWQDVRGEVWA